MTQRSSDRERGAIMTLTIFMIVAVFAVGALALDSAYLYRTRLSMQKAADAAALAAVRKRAELGYPLTTIVYPATAANPPQTEASMRDAALSAAQLNLSLDGRNAALQNANTPCAMGTVCMTFGYTMFSDTGQLDSDDVVHIDMITPVRPLLMHLVPFEMFGLSKAANFVVVRVAASGRPQKINISLLLDTSASMKCPSGSEDCSCRQTQEGCTGRLKIDDLRDSVGTFIHRYNSNRDRISMFAFNSIAKSLLDYRPAGGFSTADITTAIQQLNGLQVAGDTNLCDAFIQDYTGRKAVSDALTVQGLAAATMNDPSEINETILFSDGAPTAGRYCFTPFAADCQIDRSLDDCQFSVKLLTPTTFPNPAVETESVSPQMRCSALAGRTIDTSAMAFALGTTDPSIGEPGAREPCSNFQTANIQQDLDVNYLFGVCEQDLGFVVPGEQGSFSAVPLTEWRAQIAHCPIVWSDLLRKNLISVNALGLGEPQNTLGLVAGRQPLNPEGDDDYRQDSLLTRMTGDQAWYSGTPRTVWPPNYPPFAYNSPGTQSIFPELTDGALPPQYANYRGLYFATARSQDLPAMFRLLGLQIGSKLTR
jgi:hypothetical protein